MDFNAYDTSFCIKAAIISIKVITRLRIELIEFCFSLNVRIKMKDDSANTESELKSSNFESLFLLK